MAPVPEGGSPSAWTVFLKPNRSARLRLFCFPYAGGGAAAFQEWPRLLPAQVELCAVQPPGRERRLLETPFADLRALVAILADILAPWFDRPFAFFGHSNGALVAFELARALRGTGAPLPLHLTASGCPAPQLPSRRPPIHALPDAMLVEELRRYGGTPEEVLDNDELMHLLLPPLRADFALGETYVQVEEPPLGLPIAALSGELDDKVMPQEVTAWRAQTSATFRHYAFPGDHFFIHSDREPVLKVLAAELAPWLS